MGQNQKIEWIFENKLLPEDCSFKEDKMANYSWKTAV